MPTLIDLCGLKIDQGATFDGVSFAPLLRGEETPSTLKRTLIESYSGVVMTEKWRLVGGKELYDVEENPAQEHDVAAKHPEFTRQFREELKRNQQRDYQHTP